MKNITETLEYEISDSIPFCGKSKLQWPFYQLKVGESVWLKIKGEISQKRIKQAAYNFATKNKLSFKTRLENEGVRVWRMK